MKIRWSKLRTSEEVLDILFIITNVRIVSRIYRMQASHIRMILFYMMPDSTILDQKRPGKKALVQFFSKDRAMGCRPRSWKILLQILFYFYFRYIFWNFPRTKKFSFCVKDWKFSLFFFPQKIIKIENCCQRRKGAPEPPGELPQENQDIA